MADTYGLLVEFDERQRLPEGGAQEPRDPCGSPTSSPTTSGASKSLAAVCPTASKPVRLYESYLTNFAFANGRRRMKFTLKDYQDEAVRDVLVNLRKARKRWREDGDSYAFSLTAAPARARR